MSSLYKKKNIYKCLAFKRNRITQEGETVPQILYKRNVTQLVFYPKIAFKYWLFVRRSCYATHKKEKWVPASVPFDSGRIAVYQECSLLFCEITNGIGGNLMTVRRLWNRQVQNGYTERHAGFQRLRATNVWEDKYVSRFDITGLYSHITNLES